MKTSARNQFSGTVVAHARRVNDEVTLAIVGGQHIVATITRDSSESGAGTGVTAWALIKASSVIVVTDPQGARFSARNQLAGTISRIQEGAVNTEVSIALAGGATIAAIVTRESGVALELAVGMPATAIFKASAVILGT
jgi:molybdate transport system regulatory protein